MEPTSFAGGSPPEPLYSPYLASLSYPLPTIDLVKVAEVIKLLERDGWRVARSKGSHRQFKHSKKSGLVTVAGKPSTEIPRGTLNSILKQAGLKAER